MLKNICPDCNKKFWLIKNEPKETNPETKWYLYSKVEILSFCPLCHTQLKETKKSKQLDTLLRITLIPFILLTAFEFIEKETLLYWASLIFILLIILFSSIVDKYEVVNNKILK